MSATEAPIFVHSAQTAANSGGGGAHGDGAFFGETQYTPHSNELPHSHNIGNSRFRSHSLNGITMPTATSHMGAGSQMAPASQMAGNEFQGNEAKHYDEHEIDGWGSNDSYSDPHGRGSRKKMGGSFASEDARIAAMNSGFAVASNSGSNGMGLTSSSDHRVDINTALAHFQEGANSGIHGSPEGIKFLGDANAGSATPNEFQGTSVQSNSGPGR